MGHPVVNVVLAPAALVNVPSHLGQLAAALPMNPANPKIIDRIRLSLVTLMRVHSFLHLVLRIFT